MRSFWVFLFVLAGLVDIGLGIASYLTDALSVEDSPLPISVVCFVVGSVYLAVGAAIALAKKRKSTP